MKLLSLGILGLFALAVARPVAAGVFPYEVRRATLDNGLTVLMIPMPSEGLVAYWSIVRTGSRDEVEEGVTGFAHFFEHMMFRGSEKYPGPVYDAIVTSMGADANAYTTDDLTAYHMSITQDDLPTVIDIESDRFKNLRYSEAEFKTEAGAVYGEFRKGRTSPFRVLFEALQNAAYDRHTYKHTTIGFEQDIRRMPERYEYSKSFFQRFYRPDNVVVMVVGDFDPDATLELLRAAYGDWEPGYVAPEVPEEPEQTGQRRIVVPFEGRTLPILTIAFKGDRLRPDDKEMVAGILIEELLFGETSPLYKKLVLEEQRLQFLDADFDTYRDPGLWGVFAMVREPADVHAVEEEIWAALEELRTTPVAPERLAAVVAHHKNGFLSALSTPTRVARSVARLVGQTGDVAVVDRLFETLAGIGPDDVRQAARRYLTAERSTVAVLHTSGQEIPPPAPAPAPVELRVAQDPNVVFKLSFGVGSQNDPEGKEGLAALTAALLAEGGTRERSYNQILEDLFPLAAAYGASVDKELTVFTGVVYREAVDEFRPLLMAAVLEPGFRQEDFERLRNRAIDVLEKQLRYSSDEELGKAALFGRVFAGTPYEHLELGTVAGLRSITLDDVRRFYAAHYGRANVTLGLGGAYGEELLDAVAADLERLPAGRPEPVAPPQAAAVEGRQVVLVEKPGDSTAISFGYPIELGRGARDFYALWIANSWLGEHRNSVSHLYQVIREARGMNYGDYSYIEAFPDGGRRNMPPTGVARRQQLFEVWIRPVPEGQAVFALRAALRELDGLVSRGLTPEEFESQREFLKKYVYQFATDTEARLGYALDDRFYGIDEGHLARFRRMMDEITLEEVNAAIAKYLQSENLVIAMVTADAAAMKQALVSGEPSPIDYGGLEKPAEVLAEDREIERYPLAIQAGNVAIVPVEEMFAE